MWAQTAHQRPPSGMLVHECQCLVIDTQTQPAGADDNSPALIDGSREGMTLLWILLAVVYVACWVYFGLATFRQGHYWLLWIGFIFPILWIIGAFMAPSERVAARAPAAGV